jgi:NAD(P)-dependent dehydrogenase (short-subunit alcohol dehydrogenase family)
MEKSIPGIIASGGGENHVGRCCVVVGASYGIGRATVDLLSSRGAHVVYMARNSDKLNEAVKDKLNCYAVIMDATKDNSIKDGIDQAMMLLQTNTLDFVCYCPGYFGQDSYGSFERLFNSGDFSTGWEGSFNIHLKGMMSCFQYTRRYLLKSSRGGCFVGLSSVSSLDYILRNKV